VGRSAFEIKKAWPQGAKHRELNLSDRVRCLCGAMLDGSVRGPLAEHALRIFVFINAQSDAEDAT
jgi:hypothetical protein